MDKATHVKKQTQFSDKTLQTYYIFHVTRREQNVTLKLKTYSTHLVTLPVEVLFSQSESDDLVLRGPMTVRLTNVRYFQLKHQSSYLLISVNMISVFNGPFPASFFFILVFSVQLIENKSANDWIRTADLWYQKQLLYQLRHNHCPTFI